MFITRRRYAELAARLKTALADLDDAEEENQHLTRRAAELERQLRKALAQVQQPRHRLPDNVRELQQQLRLTEEARANLAARVELLQRANEAHYQATYDRTIAAEAVAAGDAR